MPDQLEDEGWPRVDDRAHHVNDAGAPQAEDGAQLGPGVS
jgi:hypothetical protein